MGGKKSGRKPKGYVPPSDYEPLYKQCNRFDWYNNGDSNIVAFQIDNLEVLKRTFRQYGFKEPQDFPEFKYVDGYGLPPEEQMFQREKIHEGVVRLEKRIRKSIKQDLPPQRRELTVITEFWRELNDNQDKYKSELQWINLMWYYRLFGKFFFNNGIVTYITGSYWDYLNNWTLQGEIPDYRDRDRRWQLAGKHFQTDTTTFQKRDANGKAIPEIDGTFLMKDLGVLVWFGMINTKVRRAGDSSKAAHDNTEYTNRMLEKHFGIQGKDDSNSSTMFTEHVVYPFNNSYPIFFKPLRDPAEKLNPKAEKMSFSNDESTDCPSLHSRVTFATSADALKYDMQRVDRFLIDESGKTTNTDIMRRHGIIKYCLSHGSEIRGFAYYPTTCDDISDLSAGERFMNMCFDSMWDKRDENGQTATGLCIVHFRATDGLHPYIDKYGMSMEAEAEKYISDRIKFLQKSKNYDELARFKRQHPILFKDNFTIAIKNTFFDKQILETREQYLSFDAREIQAERGNFIRESFPDGRVRWVKDLENGKFYKSIELDPMRDTNKRYMIMGEWTPDNPRQFIAGGDAFGQDKTEGRASNGGGCVKLMRDKKIDPDGKESLEWKTDLPVCTYDFRPEKVEQYCEDMLMMCQFFNAKLCEERSKTAIGDWFRKRHYGGYLLYEIDVVTKKPKNTAGWWPSHNNIIDGFNYARDDIAKNGMRWRHVDLIHQFLGIPSPEKLTDFDLLAAYLGCLIGERNIFYQQLERASTRVNVSGLLPMHKYS